MRSTRQPREECCLGTGAARRFDILAIGYACVDLVATVARLPCRDEKVLAESLFVQGGGLAATAMVAAARLGAAVSLISNISDDDTGRQIVDELEREGVDLSLNSLRPSGQSALAFAMVEASSGLRTIVGRNPTGRPLGPGEISEAEVASARVLFIDGTSPEVQKAAALAARRAGVPVIMDAEGTGPAQVELACQCDVVIGSQEFGRACRGGQPPAEAARFLHECRGVEVAAITSGSLGAFFHTREGPFHQRAYEVDVVDTTGAGDAFHGAYAFGMARGWTPQESARLAGAVASLKCRRPGGRTGLPGMGEVREFLAGHGESLPE